jgi:MerR family copper efflux transcriptional regulator
MRIGELAEQAGISTKAIRYYEQIGILTPPARTSSGYRSYDQTALGRLGFVRAAQAVGLTLGEIRQIIAFRDDGQAPCAHVTDVLQRHAADLDARIRDSSSCAASSGSWPSGPQPLIPSTVRPSGSAISSPDTRLPGFEAPRSPRVRCRWGRAATPGPGPTRRPDG